MTSDATADELVWSATLSTLRCHHPAVRDVAIRAAIVHWFDDRMLSALAQAAPPPFVLDNGNDNRHPLPPDVLMAVVESLPFVEAHGEERFRLHALVRRVLLTRLLGHDPRFVDAVSEAAASEIFRRSEANESLDVDELLELAYLLLATGDEGGPQLVADIFASRDDIFAGRVDLTVAALDRLMLYVSELSEDDRLPTGLAGRTAIWSVWAASAAGDFPRAAALGTQALRDHGADLDLADELTYELAFARWRLGDRDEAQRLAGDLADRRGGSRLGALGAMLFGDIAPSPDESRIAYGEALGSILKEVGVPNPGSISIVPKAWWTDWQDPATADEPAALVFVQSDEGTIYEIPGDGLYAELWLRLGEVDDRRGRSTDAAAWIEAAKQLFAALGDLGGLQRAEGAEQRWAAKHGDLERLRAIVRNQEDVLVWARAAGTAQPELRALLDLAEAYWRLGDLERAREHFQQAEHLAESLCNHDERAAAAEGLANVAIAQGRFEDADRHLHEAAAAYVLAGSDDDVCRLDLALGERRLAANEPVSARQAYERALEWASSRERPDDEAVARLGLARAARAQFNLSEAAEQLQTALMLCSSIHPLTELNLLIEHATVLRLQRRDADAEDTEQRLKERADEVGGRPMVAWLLVDHGDMASRRSEHAKAVHAYREALSLAEEAGEMQAVFACLTGLPGPLSHLDEHQEALATARRAMDLAASSGRPGWEVAALQTLATALVSTGQVEEAITHLLEAHRRQPGDSLICTNLGWSYLRAEKFEEAVEWSRRALDLVPADAFPYRNIGHALLGMGRIDEAKEAYQKAIEGRFGDEGFRNTLDELEVLGRSHPDLEGFEEVIAWFRAEQEKLDVTGHLNADT